MLKESEAILLRSYPLREADLLVSFFTRAEGKVKGVARAAKKSKRRFGGALEPLTHVRLYWEDRERTELARIDSCEVISSPLSETIDYPRAVALAHIAELLDELLPDRQHDDPIFRLTLAVLPHIHAEAKPLTHSANIKVRHPAPSFGAGSGQEPSPNQRQSFRPDTLAANSIWLPLIYFDLWFCRLTGLLPSLTECSACGAELNGHRAFFHPIAEGLLCARDKRLASTEISAESRSLAAQMFRAPLEAFLHDAPTHSSAHKQTKQECHSESALADEPRNELSLNQSQSCRIEPQPGSSHPPILPVDFSKLRKFLIHLMEHHIEKNLVTATMLDRL